MDKIVFLCDYPELFFTVNRWRFNEWGHLKEDASEEQFLVQLKLKSLKNQVPSVFVYLQDEVPIGTAALTEHDMLSRKDLSPWLAGVYIVPGKRRKGIGSRLVKFVMEEAVKIGIKKLYLFTSDMLPFYKKLGWILKDRVYYLGMDVDIMEINFCKQR